MGEERGRAGVRRGNRWTGESDRWRRVALTACLVALPGVDRCSVATAPRDGASVEIVLAVTGGIAPVDWQFTIDGPQGRIVGDRCRGHSACDWEPGEVLAPVSAGELAGLAGRFFEAKFFDGDAEYGSECCDQFDYALTYRDSDDARTVRGSDGTLPARVRDLIAEVRGFVESARGAG